MGAKGCKDVEQGKGLPHPHEAAILSKLNRNILAVFFVMTVLCYIDRTNLAFAALQLNTSLGFTEKVATRICTCPDSTLVDSPLLLHCLYMSMYPGVWHRVVRLLCGLLPLSGNQEDHNEAGARHAHMVLAYSNQRACPPAQVPSNMILVRVGAPKWLSIIVVSWGVCATLFAAMKTETEFYILRFLLGVTECGTFPGGPLLPSTAQRRDLHNSFR